MNIIVKMRDFVIQTKNLFTIIGQFERDEWQGIASERKFGGSDMECGRFIRKGSVITFDEKRKTIKVDGNPNNFGILTTFVWELYLSPEIKKFNNELNYTPPTDMSKVHDLD